VREDARALVSCFTPLHAFALHLRATRRRRARSRRVSRARRPPSGAVEKRGTRIARGDLDVVASSSSSSSVGSSSEGFDGGRVSSRSSRSASCWRRSRRSCLAFADDPHELVDLSFNRRRSSASSGVTGAATSGASFVRFEVGAPLASSSTRRAWLLHVGGVLARGPRARGGGPPSSRLLRVVICVTASARFRRLSEERIVDVPPRSWGASSRRSRALPSARAARASRGRAPRGGSTRDVDTRAGTAEERGREEHPGLPSPSPRSAFSLRPRSARGGREARGDTPSEAVALRSRPAGGGRRGPPRVCFAWASYARSTRADELRPLGAPGLRLIEHAEGEGPLMEVDHAIEGLDERGGRELRRVEGRDLEGRRSAA